MKDMDIYLAGCHSQGGIYHYKLSDAGQMRLCDVVPMDRPMYLFLDGNTLYVLLREPFEPGGESGLAQLEVLPNGGLRQRRAAEALHGTISAHLAARNRRVYTANYVSGDITLLPDRVVRHIGRGLDPVRQASPRPHFISFTPDGDYLAVANLGLDTVFTYDPELNLIDRARVPAGSGARHLAFSPGLRLYHPVHLSRRAAVQAGRSTLRRQLSQRFCPLR